MRINNLSSSNVPVFMYQFQRFSNKIRSLPLDFSILVLTVLLTSLDVLGPVAGPGSFVVKQSAYAELFGGGAVPASPVPGAGSLVAEDSVQPVAVFGRDRRICLAFAVAVVRTPRVIAALGDTAMLAGEHETVRTVEQLRATINALPIAIAVLGVAHHPRLRLARVLLLLLLAQRTCKRERLNARPATRRIILRISWDEIISNRGRDHGEKEKSHFGRLGRGLVLRCGIYRRVLLSSFVRD